MIAAAIRTISAYGTANKLRTASASCNSYGLSISLSSRPEVTFANLKFEPLTLGSLTHKFEHSWQAGGTFRRNLKPKYGGRILMRSLIQTFNSFMACLVSSASRQYVHVLQACSCIVSFIAYMHVEVPEHRVKRCTLLERTIRLASSIHKVADVRQIDS